MCRFGGYCQMKYSTVFFSKRTLLGKLLFFCRYTPIEVHFTVSRYGYIHSSCGLGKIFQVANEHHSFLKTKDFLLAFVIVEDEHEI
jgi:hypothetical protein